MNLRDKFLDKYETNKKFHNKVSIVSAVAFATFLTVASWDSHVASQYQNKKSDIGGFHHMQTDTVDTKVIKYK
jgi:hypothetical protein